MFNEIPCRAVFFAAMATAGWGVACQRQDAEAVKPEAGSANRAIVGGEVETGYPEVGALAKVEFGSYLGAFCTATLIDPSWALTAAHCLLNKEEGGGASVPTPETTRLYLGANAEPTGDPAINPPASGTLYEVAGFYPHPMYEYTLWSNDFDIGLVRLVEPIEGAALAVYNTEPLASEVIDRQALFLGFGYSYVDENGENGTGRSVKRSALIGLDYFWDAFITTLGGPSGICYGDSGGPALLDGLIIGVTAMTIEPDCTGGAILSRVDYYAPWIEDVMSGMGTSCLTDDSLCECPQACQADGSCDDAICDLFTCSEAYDCMVDCPQDDGGCQAQCFANADAEAQGHLDNVLACFQYFCGDITNSAQRQTCVLDHCGDEIAICGIAAPGINCRLVGGDCGSQKTCAPVRGGVPRCYESQGGKAGTTCNPAPTEPLPCQDGLVCHQATGQDSATCQPYCYDAQDCVSATCEPLGQSSGESYGVCGPEEESTDTETADTQTEDTETTDTQSDASTVDTVDTGTGSDEPDTASSTEDDTLGDDKENNGNSGCSSVTAAASPRSSLLVLMARVVGGVF